MLEPGTLSPYTMSALEKKQLDDGGATGVMPLKSSSSDTSDPPIDPEAERRLLRKLDLTLFPVFFVIYMMAFLDRINISNASIQGLTAELHLDEGNRFNVALFVWSPTPPPPVSPQTPLADHRDPRPTTPRTFSSKSLPT